LSGRRGRGFGRTSVGQVMGSMDDLPGSGRSQSPSREARSWSRQVRWTKPDGRVVGVRGRTAAAAPGPPRPAGCGGKGKTRAAGRVGGRRRTGRGRRAWRTTSGCSPLGGRGALVKGLSPVDAGTMAVAQLGAPSESRWNWPARLARKARRSGAALAGAATMISWPSANRFARPLPLGLVQGRRPRQARIRDQSASDGFPAGTLLQLDLRPPGLSHRRGRRAEGGLPTRPAAASVLKGSRSVQAGTRVPWETDPARGRKG